MSDVGPARSVPDSAAPAGMVFVERMEASKCRRMKDVDEVVNAIFHKAAESAKPRQILHAVFEWARARVASKPEMRRKTVLRRCLSLALRGP